MLMRVMNRLIFMLVKVMLNVNIGCVLIPSMLKKPMLTMPVPRIAVKFVKSFLPILITLFLSMRIFSSREVHNE